MVTVVVSSLLTHAKCVVMNFSISHLGVPGDAYTVDITNPAFICMAQTSPQSVALSTCESRVYGCTYVLSFAYMATPPSRESSAVHKRFQFTRRHETMHLDLLSRRGTSAYIFRCDRHNRRAGGELITLKREFLAIPTVIHFFIHL